MLAKPRFLSNNGDEVVGQKRANKRKPRNQGSRITLPLLLEVFGWIGLLGRLNHQLRASEAKSPSAKLPPQGVFIYFPEGWNFARVKLSSGSRFDVFPGQTNSCVDKKDERVWYVMLLKDQWVDQVKGEKWVYFDDAGGMLSLTKSLKNNCFFEEKLPAKKPTNPPRKHFVIAMPNEAQPDTPLTRQLRAQIDSLDLTDPESESSGAEVIVYPAKPSEDKVSHR